MNVHIRIELCRVICNWLQCYCLLLIRNYCWFWLFGSYRQVWTGVMKSVLFGFRRQICCSLRCCLRIRKFKILLYFLFVELCLVGFNLTLILCLHLFCFRSLNIIIVWFWFVLNCLLIDLCFAIPQHLSVWRHTLNRT